MMFFGSTFVFSYLSTFMPVFLVSNFSASVHLPQHDDESISSLLQMKIRLMWHIASNFTITFANTTHMLHLS